MVIVDYNAAVQYRELVILRRRRSEASSAKPYSVIHVEVHPVFPNSPFVPTLKCSAPASSLVLSRFLL